MGLRNHVLDEGCTLAPHGKYDGGDAACRDHFSINLFAPIAMSLKATTERRHKNASSAVCEKGHCVCAKTAKYFTKYCINPFIRLK